MKKNLNASRPSEHPPVRGENVKMFTWDQAANTSWQIQNLFTAFERFLDGSNIGSTVYERLLVQNTSNVLQ